MKSVKNHVFKKLFPMEGQVYNSETIILCMYAGTGKSSKLWQMVVARFLTVEGGDNRQARRSS